MFFSGVDYFNHHRLIKKIVSRRTFNLSSSLALALTFLMDSGLLRPETVTGPIRNKRRSVLLASI